ATNNGGAIYSTNWFGVTLNAGTITGNAAKNGGAVYIENVNASKNPIGQEILSIGSVTMTGNSASANGGAINAQNGVTINVNSGAALYNNTANDMGDDIYCTKGNALTVPEASAMSGEKILDSTGKSITGWYFDGYE